MLTSKQRAYLRGLANPLEAALHVGKSGVTPELTAAVGEALEKRELLKLGVLETCASPPPQVAETLGGRTRSEVVQVIGRKIVLYKKSREKPVIALP
jgi:RNA-binding protein